jgi:hypothetical protein
MYGIEKIPNTQVKFNIRVCFNWVLVAHTCNPSYSGGRNQEDHGLKSVWTNSLWDSTWKITHYFSEKGWWSCSRSTPWVQGPVQQKKKKKKKKKKIFGPGGANSWQDPFSKMDRKCGSRVEHLLSKCDTLSANPSSTKKVCFRAGSIAEWQRAHLACMRSWDWSLALWLIK